MKKVIKKILVGLLACSLVASVTACKSSGNTPSSSKLTKNVQIRFIWWGDTARNTKYNTVCDNFTKANPNITVVRESQSWADYWQKLSTQIAGGNAPDVMGMHPQYASDYAGRNVLLNLEPYFKDGTIDHSKISDAVYQSGKVGKLLCMISQGVTFTNLVGNSTLLSSMNTTVPSPTSDWSWDKFSTAAKQFTDAAKAAGKKVYFVNDISGQYNTFRYLVRESGTGKDIYDANGNLGFDADVVQKWFQYWKDLRDYGAIPDAATTTQDGSTALEQKLFTLGKVAVTSIPVNQMTLYAAQMPNSSLVALRNPTGPNGERGEYIEGAFLSIYSKVDKDHQKAAAEFLNFFVNSQDSLSVLKMEQGVPANTDMANFIKTLMNPVEVKEIEYVNSTLPVAKVGVYAPAGASAVDTAFKDSATQVQFGKQTPAAAATAFIANAKSILEKNKAANAALNSSSASSSK